VCLHFLIRNKEPQIPQKPTANPAPIPKYNDSLIESSSSFSVDGVAVLGVSSTVVHLLRGAPHNFGFPIKLEETKL
jgi:hypothetical protein